MTVFIYDTPTDADHLQKDITNVIGEYTGAARDAVDVQTPDIMLQATLTTGNYAYIPEFGRYYWIREKTVVRDGLTLVRMESDPEMSFLSQTLQLPAYVFRSSYNYNMDMTDNKTPCVVYDRVQVLAPQGVGGVPQFNAEDSSVYMQCIGGE